MLSQRRPPTRKWTKDVYSPERFTPTRPHLQPKGVVSTKFQISALGTISEEAQFPAPRPKVLMRSSHVRPYSPGSTAVSLAKPGQKEPPRIPPTPPRPSPGSTAVFLAQSGQKALPPVPPTPPNSSPMVTNLRFNYVPPQSPSQPTRSLESWQKVPQSQRFTLISAGHQLAEVAKNPVLHTLSRTPHAAVSLYPWIPHLTSTFKEPTYSMGAQTNLNDSRGGLSESKDPAQASQDFTDLLELNEGAALGRGKELTTPFGADMEPWQRSSSENDRNPTESPLVTARSSTSLASYVSYVVLPPHPCEAMESLAQAA